jgi:hypothetical protein
MSYLIGSNGKIITNETSESAPNAFSPAYTRGYLDKTIAEMQAEANRSDATRTTATPSATRAATVSTAEANRRASHDLLKSKGMSAARLRTLFPRLYGEKRALEYSGVGGGYELR